MFATSIRSLALSTLATLALSGAVFAQSAPIDQGLFKIEGHPGCAYQLRSSSGIIGISAIAELPFRTRFGSGGPSWGSAVVETPTRGGLILTSNVAGFRIVLGRVAAESRELSPDPFGAVLTGRPVELAPMVNVESYMGAFCLNSRSVLIAIMETIPESSLAATCGDEPSLAMMVAPPTAVDELVGLSGPDGAAATTARLVHDEEHGLLTVILTGREGDVEILAGHVTDGQVQLDPRFEKNGSSLVVDLFPLVQMLVNL